MTVPVHKVVLLGPSNCGKTSIVNRYVHAHFSGQTEATTQSAFHRRPVRSFGIECDLEIWDTAGQERYHALAPMFYRDAHGAVVVFDLTDQLALEITRQWVQELRTARGEYCALIIVGNKSDLADERSSGTAADIKRYADGNSIPYFEISAKTGNNVDAAFFGLVKVMKTKKEPVLASERKFRRNESSNRFQDTPPPETPNCC
jgi:small GTP-binding protein